MRRGEPYAADALSILVPDCPDRLTCRNPWHGYTDQPENFEAQCSVLVPELE